LRTLALLVGLKKALASPMNKLKALADTTKKFNALTYSNQSSKKFLKKYSMTFKMEIASALKSFAL
jgi:hypothetical protein